MKRENASSALKKRSVSNRAVFAVAWTVFALYAVTLFYAFLWAVVSACKTNNDFVMHMFALPETWHPENFVKAFTQLRVNVGGNVYVNLIGMLGNSIWITAGGILLSLACATTMTYVVSKYRFPGRKAVYFLNLVVMMLPIMGSLPAQYRFVTDIGIIDTPFILLMYAGAFGFNFIVLYGFFKNLPWSYAEACFIDGASDFQTFVRVMLPMTLPILTALCVISGIGIWNDYQTPMLYLKSYPNLALGLYKFDDMMIYQADYPTLFAGFIISAIPIFVIFACFSETIMSNVTMGGLKG